MVVALEKDLVAGGLFGVGGQPVVFQGVTGDTGDVLHRQVQYSMFGDRSMPVAQHPALVEVRRLFLSDLLGDFIEGLRPAGGHGEGDGYLLLRQLSGVQGIDPAGIVGPGGISHGLGVLPGLRQNGTLASSLYQCAKAVGRFYLY